MSKKYARYAPQFLEPDGCHGAHWQDAISGIPFVFQTEKSIKINKLQREAVTGANCRAASRRRRPGRWASRPPGPVAGRYLLWKNTCFRPWRGPGGRGRPPSEAACGG
jgi:hypothetical protein